MAAVTATVRATVRERARNRCERCYRTLGGWDGESVHHRTPRGMGGSRDPALGQPANLLLLCGSGTTGCHGWVESNREYATDLGLLVRRHNDPDATPYTDIGGYRWLLDNQGGKTPYPHKVD